MKVALAISSYAGDMAALALVGQACSDRFDGIFEAVAVIDSGPEDRCATLRDVLAEHHPDVEYRWRPENLGAAGNLRLRIEWATEVGADALLAVNSDGRLDPTNARTLIGLLDTRQLAAAYPTAVLEGERVDLSYRRPVPVIPSRRPLQALADRSAISVSWGSSNGALYRLSTVGAIRIERVEDLWHGWEDLAMGLAIRAHGGAQMMSLSADQPTASDQRRLRGTGPVVSDKAPWTTYYTVRNLLLIARDHPRLRHRVILRILREFVVISLRDRRRERYRSATAGLVDGLRGITNQRGSAVSG